MGDSTTWISAERAPAEEGVCGSRGYGRNRLFQTSRMRYGGRAEETVPSSQSVVRRKRCGASAHISPGGQMLPHVRR